MNVWIFGFKLKAILSLPKSICSVSHLTIFHSQLIFHYNMIKVYQFSENPIMSHSLFYSFHSLLFLSLCFLKKFMFKFLLLLNTWYTLFFLKKYHQITDSSQIPSWSHHHSSQTVICSLTFQLSVFSSLSMYAFIFFIFICIPKFYSYVLSSSEIMT